MRVCQFRHLGNFADVSQRTPDRQLDPLGFEGVKTVPEGSLFAFCSESFYDEHNWWNRVKYEGAEVAG